MPGTCRLPDYLFTLYTILLLTVWPVSNKMVCCTTEVFEYFAIENSTHQSHTVITTGYPRLTGPTYLTFWHITPFVAFCCHNDTTRASPAHHHGTSGTVCCQWWFEIGGLPSVVSRPVSVYWDCQERVGDDRTPLSPASVSQT